MKTLAAILFAAATILPPAAHAAEQPDDAVLTAAATEAAEHWLALADAGKWTELRTISSLPHKDEHPDSRFGSGMEAIRHALGPVRERHLQSATVTHAAPGSQQGDQVVLRYETVFTNPADANRAEEILTPMRLADGTWRVVEYHFERPGLKASK